MQGKRTTVDAEAKAIEIKMNNPRASTRDIAKATWIWKTKVAEAIKEIPELVDKNGQMIEKLDSIIDTIANITEISLWWFQEKAKENKLKTRELQDLNNISKTNFERKQLLTGKPTEIKNINIDLTDMNMKELEEYRQQFL